MNGNDSHFLNSFTVRKKISLSLYLYFNLACNQFLVHIQHILGITVSDVDLSDYKKELRILLIILLIKTLQHQFFDILLVIYSYSHLLVTMYYFLVERTYRM